MGVFASLLSACFAASKDLLSKRISFKMDGTTSTFTSFAYALPFYLVALAALALLGEDVATLTPTFLTLVVLRSVTDTFAEGMKMYAFAHGDISVVATFFSISPLFLLFLSPAITRDVPSLPGAVAVVLVVGGSLVMVYRPSSVDWARQRKGILLAAGASLFFSLNSCFDRLAVQKETAARPEFARPLFAGFAMTLLSALILVPLVVGRRDRIDAMRSHPGGLLARGFLEVAFMVSKLYALQTLPPADVAGLQRLSLVPSIVGGAVFFREPDFVRRLLAGLLILGGVFLIAYMQW